MLASVRKWLSEWLETLSIMLDTEAMRDIEESEKKEFSIAPVLVWNPRAQMYTVIDKIEGKIVGHTKWPWEGVPIVENASKYVRDKSLINGGCVMDAEEEMRKPPHPPRWGSLMEHVAACLDRDT